MRDQQRRGAVCAALAAVVGILSLSMVVSGTAGAANTASELLVERSDRVSVASEPGIRPFGGADRYGTAVLLAERFAQQRGGLGAVSTVILVSGESPADGLVATGLAGRHQAPILLTPRDALPNEVAEFLDRYDVSSVIVVGGTEAVSDQVLSGIASLEVSPSVRRLAGEDRFATAVTVASQLDSEAAWCGADGAAAVLVHGSDEHLSDGIGLGVLAFARELPIVLTRGDDLPLATAHYLREHRIDRVVIVGGTSVVSDAVLSPILAQGVDEITRVAAAPAGMTEVAMAQLMIDACQHDLTPSSSVVALAGRHSALDAVAAAPLLAVGVDGSGPVPLLLAADPLAASVRGFLARTPLEVDGRKNHVHVVAIGGHGAIGEATMAAAVDAAASARALTARINASAGDRKLRISFSERLEVDVPLFYGRLRDLLYVNDFPAWIADLALNPSITSDPCGRFAAVDVTLTDEIEAGDVIELESAEDWPSIEGDRREIRGVAYRVPDPRPLLSRPAIEVIAQPEASTLWVSVQADEYRDPDIDADDIAVNPSRIRVRAEDGTAVIVGQPAAVRLDRFLGTRLYSFPLRSADGDYALAPGDLVTVRNSLAVNASEQRSGGRNVAVAEPDTQLGITAVRIGAPNPGVDESVRTTRPEEIADISRRAQASLGSSLYIVAKWSGAAAGAAGNAWEIYSTRSNTASGAPPGDPPATQVWVDTRNQLITIRHINAPEGTEREQTYGELVELLNGNRAFSQHFTAELTEPCEGDQRVVDLDEDGLIGNADFAGGISSISFLVTFDEYVKQFETDGATVVDSGAVGELIDDVLGAFIPDYEEAPTNYEADRVEIAAPVPGTEVLFRFTTQDPEHTIGQQINFRRKVINIREGIASGFRLDDPTTDDTDESTNKGRALFPLSSRDPRLLTDLPNGANSG